MLKHKYTLTGGMTIQRDEIQQTIRPDADDPARLCLAWTNFDTTKNYYLTANAPFQFTKWWTMNLNLTYIRQGQRIDEHRKRLIEQRRWTDRNDQVDAATVEWMHSLGYEVGQPRKTEAPAE